jgi:hypothetical protein
MDRNFPKAARNTLPDWLPVAAFLPHINLSDGLPRSTVDHQFIQAFGEMTQYTSVPLFGGAITASLPSTFADVRFAICIVSKI